MFMTTQIALADYPDVPPTNEHYIPVQYLTPFNYFSTFPDGNFHPEQFLTYGEAVKLILDSSSIAPSTPSPTVFADVSSTDQYANYIQKAKDLGLLDPDGDNKVHPAENMIRSKFIKILLKANSFNESGWQNQFFYKDVPVGAWFNAYMNFAGVNAMIVPDENGYVFPSQAISRGEAAEALYVAALMRNRTSVLFLAQQTISQISQTKTYLNNSNFASADRASAFADSLGQQIFRLLSSSKIMVGKAKISRAYRNLIKAYIAKKRNKIVDAKIFADAAIAKSAEAVDNDTSNSSDANNVTTLAAQFEN